MNLETTAYTLQKHSHMPQFTSTACPFAKVYAFSMEYTTFLSSSFVNIPSQDARASSDKLG